MPERLSVKSVLRTYAILLLAPLLLLAPILLRGQTLFWGTPSLQFVPWYTYAVESLRQGSLPLWNSLNGMGAPLLANYQTAFLYPPNWILLLLGLAAGPEYSAAAVALGYLLLSVLHLAWAGLGMALLLRLLGYQWLGQIIGGLAFGLSGYVIGRLGFFSMVWVAAWLPWVIYFADRIASPLTNNAAEQSGRFRLVLGLVIALAMQLLAGHAQLTWYSILLAGMWVTVGTLRGGGIKRLLWGWLSFVAAGLLASGLAAAQLVPTFAYLQLSQRADAVAVGDAMTYSFWPWRLITLFAPDFFGSPAGADFWGYASYWEDHAYLGMLPLLLALSTLIILVKGLWRKGRARDWFLVLFLWAGLLLTFVLALGKFTPVFPFLYYHVPTFDMFQAPARYLIWAAFALPVLAAAAVERWRSPTGRGLYWFRLGTAGAFAITLGAMLAWQLMDNVRLTFIRAAALAGLWALGFGLLTLAKPLAEKHVRLPLWQWSAVAWVLLDLLFTGWNLNPGTPLSFYTYRPALPPVSSGERIYLGKQTEYDLKFRRFLRFEDFTPLENWQNQRDVWIPNLNLLDGVALANNFDPLIPDHYGRWMKNIDAMGPETQQSWLAWSEVGAVETIDLRQPNGIRFDALTGAARWHWYRCTQFNADPEQVWRAMEQEMAFSVDTARTLLLEGRPPKTGQACDPAGQAAQVLWIEERPGSLVLEVNAGSDGWLEIMNTWYPGWRATVDGSPAVVYRADGAFLAVPVSAGSHKVELYYTPSGFIFGSLFSILVLLFVLFLWRKMGAGRVT